MTPELACIVLSYRDEPWLVDAVRSVLDQDELAEVFVVNSGGGDPARRLVSAGLDVPVVNRPDRLYAGGARNIGIRESRAPFVAFLAADCVALPGWVAGRLREHRAGAAAVGARLTNAYPDRLSAWASLLLLNSRQIPARMADERLIYGLSYDRALFAGYGEFDETLRAGEDTEFNARFRGDVRIVRAHDVRTAHRYPETPRAFLADAHRRGGLQAAMLGRIAGTKPQRTRVVLRTGIHVASSLRYAWAAPAGERARLLAAWPLVVVGSAAYTAGAIRSDFGQNRYDARRPTAEAIAQPDSGRGAHAGSG
jgi:glycosyltransferase involved in cell wall biosynthesis